MYKCHIVQCAQCDKQALSRLILESITGSKLLSDVGAELTYQLPVDQSPLFAALFSRFDSDRDILGIREYGISVTTMEEIFLRVAGGYTENDAKEMGAFLEQTKAKSPVTSLSRTSQSSTILAQTSAIFVKRVQCARRDLKAVMCSLVLPILLVIIGMAIIKFTITSKDDPSKVLAFSRFDEHTFPYAFADSAVSSNDADDFMAELGQSADPNSLSVNDTLTTGFTFDWK
jgi:ATP-binding cassette subfamily A (ABC1) protein 3